MNSGYTKAPNRAVKELGRLLPLYLRLRHYQDLSENLGNGPAAFPGQELLASDVGISSRQVKRNLAALEEAGWVVVERRKARQVNRYRVHDAPVPEHLRSRMPNEASEGDGEEVAGTSVTPLPASGGPLASPTRGQQVPPSKTDPKKTERGTSKTEEGGAGAPLASLDGSLRGNESSLEDPAAYGGEPSELEGVEKASFQAVEDGSLGMQEVDDLLDSSLEEPENRDTSGATTDSVLASSAAVSARSGPEKPTPVLDTSTWPWQPPPEDLAWAEHRIAQLHATLEASKERRAALGSGSR